MLKKYSISLIVAVVLITPITVFALVHWMEKKWRALPVFEGKQYTLTDFSLTNQRGETVTLQNWKGQIVVANFFFTHCPVICPKMTRNLKKVADAFGNESGLLITSFSVDPERDSVAELKRFADRFDLPVNWHLLTGNKKLIYGLARNNFAVAAAEGMDNENDFIHSDKLVLLDKNHRIRGYYNGTSDKTAPQLIQDIKKLQDEK